jgi:hypothetical protein
MEKIPDDVIQAVLDTTPSEYDTFVIKCLGVLNVNTKKHAAMSVAYKQNMSARKTDSKYVLNILNDCYIAVYKKLEKILESPSQEFDYKHTNAPYDFDTFRAQLESLEKFERLVQNKQDEINQAIQGGSSKKVNTKKPVAKQPKKVVSNTPKPAPTKKKETPKTKKSVNSKANK